MSCADGCFQTCCIYYCSVPQPISSSGPAICAAEDTTIGTCDTINGLVSSGLSAVGAIFGAKQQTNVATTAVKAQAQVATQKTSAMMWVAIAVVAVIGFIFLFRR